MMFFRFLAFELVLPVALAAFHLLKENITTVYTSVFTFMGAINKFVRTNLLKEQYLFEHC